MSRPSATAQSAMKTSFRPRYAPPSEIKAPRFAAARNRHEPSLVKGPARPYILLLPDERLEDILRLAISSKENAFTRQRCRHTLSLVCKRFNGILNGSNQGSYALRLGSTVKKGSLCDKIMRSKGFAKKVKELTVEFSFKKNEQDYISISTKLFDLFMRTVNLRVLHLLAPRNRTQPVVSLIMDRNKTEIKMFPKGDVALLAPEDYNDVDKTTLMFSGLMIAQPRLQVFSCSAAFISALYGGRTASITAENFGSPPDWQHEHDAKHRLVVDLVGGISSLAEDFVLALFGVSECVNAKMITVGGTGCPHHPTHPPLDEVVLPETKDIWTQLLYIGSLETAIEWFGRFINIECLGVMEVIEFVGEEDLDPLQSIETFCELIASLPRSLQQLQMGALEDAELTTMVEEACQERDLYLRWY